LTYAAPQNEMQLYLFYRGPVTTDTRRHAQEELSYCYISAECKIWSHIVKKNVKNVFQK
jgi:hypothetical protein